MKKLLFKWDKLSGTFWFIPVMIIIISILLSFSLVYLDSIFTLPQNSLGRLFVVNSSDSARIILSTISGAMLGVAGTVFSITLVVLTLASSQFGPSLIKNFMYVRLNQVVLGSYISTYLYCLLVLNAIKDGENYTFIPSISIIMAIVIAIANIVLLIIFIHRIAVSIQADKVISDISIFISQQLETLFPEKIEEKKEFEDNDDLISAFKKRIPINSPKSGYLQYIDNEALIEMLGDRDSLLELYYRPGGHLVEGLEIGVLYLNENWEKPEFTSIFEHLVIGKTKTSQQDLEFSIYQMVEIASRALSPGVNDPFTAISCIDNLTTTMCYLAKAKFPSKYRFDSKGNLRIIADVLNFEGVLDAAFNQIRQYSIGSIAVIIRLMKALVTIYKFTSKENHKKAVMKHAEMVLRLGKETIKELNDLTDLTNIAEEILKDGLAMGIKRTE
ncbi:DUF2254 domain-containing protein [Mongoliitalea daihaiensis]|uniref:DUF2254 domain-containing protein n=1 Tax=Mongoliitalea daihaiensis TaxID=2782006 RepID=UPI001F2D158F|nr:DUF2254 domain-containing protein [Mongoliitalea daihaiensis]UJP63787.1 DUF2254 domain-containing protein [Mongoliitalea daihaiensis]